MLHRVMPSVLILLFGVLAGSAALAQGSPGPGLYIRAQLGYAWPSLDDVNREIRSEEEAARPVTTLLEWEELPPGGRYSAEVGYSISTAFSLGLEFGYQKNARDHLAMIQFDNGTAIVSGRVDEEVKASLFTVMLTPTFHVRSVGGLHFGAQLGMGRGSFDRTETDKLSATDGSFLDGTIIEEYDETALAGGLFAGFDFPISPDAAFSLRAGYLMSSFSSMDGPFSASGTTDLGPFADSGSASLMDSNGDPLEVSFSGLNLSAGFVFRFSSGP